MWFDCIHTPLTWNNQHSERNAYNTQYNTTVFLERLTKIKSYSKTLYNVSSVNSLSAVMNFEQMSLSLDLKDEVDGASRTTIGSFVPLGRTSDWKSSSAECSSGPLNHIVSFGWRSKIRSRLNLIAGSDQRRHITWRGTGVDVEHQETDLVCYTGFDGKPVELTKGWSYVVSRLQSFGKPCGTVEDGGV